MSWFGWITKTKMEVTGLDELISAGEMLALIAVGGTVWIGIELLRDRRRKKLRLQREGKEK